VTGTVIDRPAPVYLITSSAAREGSVFHIEPLFRALAEQVREAVNADRSAAGWTVASLDVRYSPDGTRRLKKLRADIAGRARRQKKGQAQAASRTVSVSVLYGDISRLVRNIWAARGAEELYGFVLSVRPSGEVEIRLNYDPECSTDPGFFES
jgi:hypothetical protein